MNTYALDLYRQMFLSLKRGRNSVGGKSNAKPILLISILELIPTLNENVIRLSDILLNNYYKTNCKLYDCNISSPIIFPYYHLQSEPFYEIIWKDKSKIPIIKHSPSPKLLSDYIVGTKLDEVLWELLQVPENREYLRNCIINQYLSYKKTDYGNNI